MSSTPSFIMCFEENFSVYPFQNIYVGCVNIFNLNKNKTFVPTTQSVYSTHTHMFLILIINTQVEYFLPFSYNTASFFYNKNSTKKEIAST